MKERFKKYIMPTMILISLIVITFLGVKTCTDSNYIKKIESSNRFMSAKYAQLEVKYNKVDSTYTYYKQGYIGTQTELKVLKEQNKQLYELVKDKDVATGIITDTKLQIKEVIKEVVVTKDTSGNDVRKSVIVKPEYTADITSYKDSTLLKLESKTRLNITVGKDGVLNVTPSNKYLTVTDIQGYTKVTPQKKTNKWLWFGVGVVAGGFTTYKLAK